jgi:hypothetical protein
MSSFRRVTEQQKVLKYVDNADQFEAVTKLADLA